MTSRQALLTFTSLMLAGCAATDPGTGSTRGEVITVDYGTVMQVEQVQMDPKYGTGALVGGGLGLAAASRRSGTTQAGAAIAGALIGAMIQKSKAGTADKYTVRLNNGGTIQMVTEHHDIESGDCVSVEQGKHANIRRVSPIISCPQPDRPLGEVVVGVEAHHEICAPFGQGPQIGGVAEHQSQWNQRVDNAGLSTLPDVADVGATRA